MKRTIALILALVLCLAFIGCKKETAAPAGSSVPGSSQTGGDLTVFVPEGWSLVADEANTNQVYLCKGGSDISKSAYVKLTGNSALPAEGTCTDVQPLEARTYGSLSWSGFSGIKPSGSAVYLITQTDTGSILATLWYTQETGVISPDDQAVQAILGSVVYAGAASAQPDTTEPASTPEVTSMIGDWSGTLELMDCSGDLEDRNGASYPCIARFTEDENGNITPYIGVEAEGGPITNLSVTATDGEMATTVSGAWQGISFSDCVPSLGNGTLQLSISICTETGTALLVITLSPLTGTDFDTQAAQLGCTGY